MVRAAYLLDGRFVTHFVCLSSLLLQRLSIVLPSKAVLADSGPQYAFQKRQQLYGSWRDCHECASINLPVADDSGDPCCFLSIAMS